MTIVKKITIMNHTSLIVLIIAGAFISFIIAGMVYPYKTIDFSRFVVDDIYYRPYGVGRLVKISWTFDKYVSLPADYSISLIPELHDNLNNTYVLESGTVNSPIGQFCSSKLIKVSEEVFPGIYRVRLTLQYRVNPFRYVTKIFNTQNTVTIGGQ